MRAKEIHELNSLSADELCRRAGDRLLVLDTIDDLHAHFARSIATRVAANNQAKRPTRLILPYGPAAQYPILRDIVNRERISLNDATLFFMDEYAGPSGRAVASNHPLSFRGAIAWLWSELAPALRPKPENVHFPDQDNSASIARDIASSGVEVCYGGVGIHGHVAFNEPAADVSNSSVRLVELNDFTVTINSIRSQIGGDLENFPRKAWTLGMTECLAAERIELYCRNDIPGVDWANTVLRLAVLGEPGDDYPVTWIREHANYQVVTDRRTAEPPENLLELSRCFRSTLRERGVCHLHSSETAT